MPEGPYKLPKGWRWVRLGEVARLIQTGFAIGKKGISEGDHLLHLRPYNIGDDGTISLTQQFYVPKSVANRKITDLEPGDVLFNNTNSVELIGKTALVRQPIKAGFSNHITLIRSHSDKCEGPWLASVLRALWYQGKFVQICNKWIGQAGINTKVLRKLLIPLPPLEEQRRIVAYLDEVQAKITALKKHQEETTTEFHRLERAILDKAFMENYSAKAVRK